MTNEERPKNLLTTLRKIAFVVYAVWLKFRMSRWISGDLIVGDETFKIKRINKRYKTVLDDFLNREADDDDLTFVGIRSKRINYNHPSIAYFGIFKGSELASVGWFVILGRKKVERIILVGKSWRRLGLRTSWHVRNDQICKKHGLRTFTKINENNELMLNIYRQRGVKLNHKEGHLYVFEEQYD